MRFTMTPQAFYQVLIEHGITLTDKQKKQFETYFRLLVEWNEKINLTAITDKEEVYLKHFYDSIAPILQGYIDNSPLSILDIGAGAGFPSIPMKILYPEIDITIIDSLNKRINFLNILANELELSGVHFFHGRAEDFGQDKVFRAKFDIVTARAVARMQVLAELTIPFLKVNGRLIALKAAAAEEELISAEKALKTLFSQVTVNKNYKLPNGDDRNITIVSKKKETPNKYPRKAGTPNKKPL
ncbi:Glucose-inhibited division protein B [Streptococcus agalactiae]|nr:Glucose-inhibited division protein B [Streptococcus agalactiae]